MARTAASEPNVYPFARARAKDTYPLADKCLPLQHHDNNYYYTRAREEDGKALEDVAQMYYDTMMRPMPRFIAQEVEQLMQSGIAADMICAVLAYTAGAPRPSWAYARAVIQKQAARGARTAADFNGNVQRWRQEREVPAAAPMKRVVEQRYTQRDYNPEEYDQLPPELLAEAKLL